MSESLQDKFYLPKIKKLRSGEDQEKSDRYQGFSLKKNISSSVSSLKLEQSVQFNKNVKTLPRAADLIKSSMITLTPEQTELQQEVEHKKRVFRQIQTDVPMVFYDRLFQPLVGQNAINGYYKHNKLLNRINEQNQIGELPNSAFTCMLSKSESLVQIPRKLGIVKFAGDKNHLKIPKQYFGDRHMSIIAEGIKRLPDMHTLTLNNNSISEKSSSILINAFNSEEVLQIDLNNNRIGKEGCEKLSWFISQKNCQLEKLLLANNKLGDVAIQILLKSLENNKTVKELDISKNLITDESAESLKELIAYNSKIQQLYLYWNKLKSLAGKSIFQALQSNETIMVLDLSFNMLGGIDDLKQSAIVDMKDWLLKSPKIIHLDLSNNNFSYDESLEFSKVFNLNQTIIGFHFKGNCGYVDNKGFLIVEQEKSSIGDSVTQYRINDVKQVYNQFNKSQKIKDICWICEGWQEQQFDWIPIESGEAKIKPIYVHFDFEEYQTSYIGRMNRKITPKTFQYKRMVPEGQTKFFWTAKKQHIVNKLYTKKSCCEYLIRNLEFWDGTVNHLMTEYNIIEKNDKHPMFDGYDYLFKILPRTPQPVYIPPKLAKDKKIWTFPISIMYPWIKHDQNHLDKSFELDFSQTKITKMIKDESDLQKTKEVLRQCYSGYRDCYKYYASINPVQDIWCIQAGGFDQLIADCKVVDENIGSANVNIKKDEATAACDIKTKTNPAKGIIRYQLMEIIVRIGKFKYIESMNECTTWEQSTIKILENHFQPQFNKLNDIQKWRDERYWNEQCDQVLKYYKNILENIYKNYSKKKVTPGQKPFMCLDELNDLCKNANLYNQGASEASMMESFNLSMMPQVDEIFSNRIFEMSFVEFLETLARLAESMSLQPYAKTDEMPLEQRKQLPLCQKLESLCAILCNTLADFKVKQTFKLPARSLFDVDAEEIEIDSDDE